MGCQGNLKLGAIGPVRSFCFLLLTEQKFRQRSGRVLFCQIVANTFRIHQSSFQPSKRLLSASRLSSQQQSGRT
jgi:hypothetical protein